MRGSRLMICATGLIVFSWALVSAQDAAPKAQPRTAENASPGTPRPQTLSKAPAGPFSVKPYLQLGHTPAPGKLVLVWHTTDAGADAAWTVDYRPGTGRPWQTASAPAVRRVAVPGVEPHQVYHVALTGLEPGETFGYRVSKAGVGVFESESRAPKAAGQPHRFVVFGDCGADTPKQRLIAYRAFLCRPDFVMITGDIVYSKGLVSEYRDK